MAGAERRKPLTFRLSSAGHLWFSDLQTEYEVSKTDVFRALMVVVRRHETELRTLIKEMK